MTHGNILNKSVA